MCFSQHKLFKTQQRIIEPDLKCTLKENFKIYIATF